MTWEMFKRAASRRTFLKGLGLGAAGALMTPMLNRLAAEASGQAPRKRVMFVVEGNGFYGFRDWKRLTMTSPEISPLDTLPDQVALLAPYQDRVTLLNGLANKQGTGKYAGHFSGYYPLTCLPYAAGGAPGGVSIDAYLGQTIGAQDIFSTVRLGANGEEGGLSPVISAAGPGVALPTQHNVRAAYSELFGVVAADTDQASMFSERGMLLDYMKEDIQRVLPHLSAEERWKFERYLYSVETFQVRQQRLSGYVDVLNACAPAQAAPLPMDPDVSDRLAIQFDLGTLAMICGLTHVVTIAAGAGQFCHSTFSKWGHTGKHSLGHGSNGGPTALMDIHNKIAGLIKGVADQLAAVPEGDGTMLDHTAIIFLNDNGSEHHSYYDNFPAVILGDLGGAFKPGGRLIEYPHRGRPGSRGLPELWNSVCHAMGAPKDDFAKQGLAPSDGPLPELMA